MNVATIPPTAIEPAVEVEVKFSTVIMCSVLAVDVELEVARQPVPLAVVNVNLPATLASIVIAVDSPSAIVEDSG